MRDGLVSGDEVGDFNGVDEGRSRRYEGKALLGALKGIGGRYRVRTHSEGGEIGESRRIHT